LPKAILKVGPKVKPIVAWEWTWVSVNCLGNL